DEGFLCEVFGEADVADATRQGCHDLGRLHPPHRFDGLSHAPILPNVRQEAQPTARSAPSQNFARTAFLSGLPSPVSGSESTTTTCLGDCTDPLRCFPPAWISTVIRVIDS